MASTNQSPNYQKAEVKFFSAKNTEEKIEALEEMIRECPKHKSSEKMLANLKTRYKKLKGGLERLKKTSSSKKGIKKEDMQAAIISKENLNKSLLLPSLTNKKSQNSEELALGTINYSSGAQVQLVELPEINSQNFDKGIVNSADVLVILVSKLEEIGEIKERLQKATGKQIIAFDKTNLSKENSRKIEATLKSKRHEFVILDFKEKQTMENLKNKIFQKFDIIRVYTKEPGKKDRSKKPIILDLDSSVKEVAEKILKGFSEKIKTTKIWGPSSKFPGQIVGLNHKLKDLDVVEFRTK
ncbi:MAG: TGS domain-containing protein [Candidatus Pacearchaeota archaeon]